MEVCKEWPKCTVLGIVRHTNKILKGITDVAISRPSTFSFYSSAGRGRRRNMRQRNQDRGKCALLFTDKHRMLTRVRYPNREKSNQLVTKVGKRGIIRWLPRTATLKAGKKKKGERAQRYLQQQYPWDRNSGQYPRKAQGTVDNVLMVGGRTSSTEKQGTQTAGRRRSISHKPSTQARLAGSGIGLILSHFPPRSHSFLLEYPLLPLFLQTSPTKILTKIVDAGLGSQGAGYGGSLYNFLFFWVCSKFPITNF